VAGEVIKSLEGRQTAVEGDWVIRGSEDEEWVTTAEHFAGSYEVRDSAPRNTAKDHVGVASPAPPAD
jgi:hypothetical protein